MAIASKSNAPEFKPVQKRSADLSPQSIFRQRFGRHKLAVVGLAILLLLLLFSFVGPAFSRFGSEEQFVAAPNGSFTPDNLLGTDELGRDVMTRLMWAGRISLIVSIIVTVISTAIGVAVGAASGYFGGAVDTVAMRVVDFMLTLPQLPLLLILSAMSLRGGLPVRPPEGLNRLLGSLWGMSSENAENLLILIAVLILFGWLGTARLIRGQILSLREMGFSDAARSLGASSFRIIFQHMIPNSVAPIIVSMTFGFGDVIITEAALSFIGFGVQPPSPSWGNMLNGVRDFMLIQPWRALVPGMAIFLASISFNFIGDALRDALDPRLKM